MKHTTSLRVRKAFSSNFSLTLSLASLTSPLSLSLSRTVPDSIVNKIVQKRLLQVDCQERGWILDGFPRTLSQAQALDQMNVVPSHFINLEVDEDVCVSRALGRRVDPITGQIFHVDNLPAPEGAVSDRAASLKSDTEENVRKALQAFQSNISDLKDFYSHIKSDIDGSLQRSEIASSIMVQFVSHYLSSPRSALLLWSLLMSQSRLCSFLSLSLGHSPSLTAPLLSLTIIRLWSRMSNNTF